MTNILRGVGNSPDFALYGGSPQAVKNFERCQHDGCLTIAVLFRSPKTEKDPDFEPCVEFRYHNGDGTPGGYTECPAGGLYPGLTKEEVQACIDAALADLAPDTNNELVADADGSITITSPLTGESVTVPPPTPPETDGVHVNGALAPVVDLDAQTITYATVNDADESAGPDLLMDISGLIALLTSTPHPELLAGDGITITGDDSVGYTLSVSDADVVCTFVTNSDGTITKTAQPTVNGEPSGAATTTVLGLPQKNCIENITCANGGLRATFSDGSVKHYTVGTFYYSRGFTSNGITPASAAGDLYRDEDCHSFTLPACGAFVNVLWHGSANASGDMEGDAFLTHQVKINGGSYFTVGPTGFHRVAPRENGETSMPGRIALNLGAGPQTICTRTTLFANALSAGSIVGSAQGVEIQYPECREC